MARRLVLRGVVAAVFGLVGWRAGLIVGDVVDDAGYLPWGLALTLFGLVLGILLAPHVLIGPLDWSSRKLRELSIATLTLALAGLLVGLLSATLLNISLGRIPGALGWALPIGVSLALGSLGAVALIFRGGPLVQQIPALRQAARERGTSTNLVLMDTSAIIDGRVVEVVATGFLQGTLGVPQFILDELRHIADSSDVLRRNRGRRGLEVLNQLRRDSKVPVQVLDANGRNGVDVDARLVQLAQQLKASILTTDFNLNRVAELQGVHVLNVNELANAIKPVVLPGEEMSVRVIQEGREAGQGVAFLDDGTMVVVEGGKRYINSHLDVAITRVLQTAQGRIIFAQPKGVQ